MFAESPNFRKVLYLVQSQSKQVCFIYEFNQFSLLDEKLPKQHQIYYRNEIQKKKLFNKSKNVLDS